MNYAFLTYSSYIKYPRIRPFQYLLDWTEVWDFSQHLTAPQEDTHILALSSVYNLSVRGTHISVTTNAGISYPSPILVTCIPVPPASIHQHLRDPLSLYL
jgi:hypothetical protein